MNESYARDLDLNLLRVFAVVVEAGSVTAAAARLYLTQPAVSAALKRLTEAVGAPLFVRAGRNLALTTRGRALFDRTRPLVRALAEATRAGPALEIGTSRRVVRVGLSDAAEGWLLPGLVRAALEEGPGLAVASVPVHFRTIAEALSSGRVELAVTVADALPADVRREPLHQGRFALVFDGAARTFESSPTLEAYLAAEHVVVSYNGDLRGVVEDALGVQRRVRCSVSSFDHPPTLLAGTALVATVPGRSASRSRGPREYDGLRGRHEPVL